MRYSNEIIKTSRFYYAEGYLGPNPIVDQIRLIGELFKLDTGPALLLAKDLPSFAVPSGAEGWFVKPKESALARDHFPDIEDKRVRHCEATKLALEMLKTRRHLLDTLADDIAPDKFRPNELSAYAMSIIEDEQPGDIVIFPAQFGARYRGHSSRLSLEIMNKGNREFGLDVFSIACMALCHDNIFRAVEELGAICAGDEFCQEKDIAFSSMPCLFTFNGLSRLINGLNNSIEPISDGRLTLAADHSGSYAEIFGAASFFLPPIMSMSE